MAATPSGDEPLRPSPARWAWLALGWTAVGLGGLGVVVPGLPTTGFFVLAASCFARSSPRFERWVLSLPTIGPLVADHRAGLGMPRRAKVTAIAMMVTAVAASAGLALTSGAARLSVVAAGAVGVWFVGWRIPTRERVVAGLTGPDRRPPPPGGRGHPAAPPPPPRASRPGRRGSPGTGRPRAGPAPGGPGLW